ncbi:DoxX family protein [Trueperella sp. LYQ143]|uniref:DoxX family protein n=1 Tax=unclassified Trueperella TaxID=2630174 RepID=UPI0039830518
MHKQPTNGVLMFTRLARPLLAAPFVASGVDALIHPARHREAAERGFEMLERFGVPAPSAGTLDLATRASGAVFTIAGLSLARGRTPRSAAFLLGSLQLPIAIARYPFWSQRGTQRSESLTGLLSSLGLVGGALIAAQDRGGKPSMTYRVGKWAENARQTAQDRLPTR